MARRLTFQRGGGGGAAATPAAIGAVAVGAEVGDPITAPSGYWQGAVGSFAAGTIATLTSGLLTFHPIDVGPASKAFTAMGCGITTAAVAGTITMTLALYPDDGTGGMPQCSAGPIVTGAVTITATGNASFTFTHTLAPGRYWAAALYVATAAPSTNPQGQTLTNVVNGPLASSDVIGTGTSRGWSLATQTVMPSTDIRGSLARINSGGPVLCALKAA